MLATASTNQALEILLAEDNGGDVCLIERALRQAAAPCRVHVLDNGVRALAFLRREEEYSEMPRPDVVILDLNLPRKSGLEVLSELKRDPELRRIPVVVLSSSRAESDVASAYEAQATAYFVKPVSDYRTVIELIIRFVFAAERPANTVAALARVEHSNAELAERVSTSLAALSRARLLSTIVECAADAIMSMDLNGTISSWNAAAERLFGFTAAEALGRPITEIIPDERLRWQGPSDAGDAARLSTIDGVRIDRFGQPKAVALTLSPLVDTDGGLIGVAAIARDVTERTRHEEVLLARTKELLRSNSELEQFAYVASHDLQEPLRMVASYTRLLAEEYAAQLGKDGQQFVRFARDGAERMQQLIHDLLAYSRVGSRGQHATLVSAQTCLDAALANLRISLDETECVVRSTGLPSVLMDPVQLAELFQNLISNAIKFRSDQAPLIEVSCEAVEASFRFAVRDNGIGMEAQHFDEVFQVFKRLHSKQEYPGTGIGLAICKRIVERAGGRIWIESTLGKGSTFYFTLSHRPAQPRA